MMSGLTLGLMSLSIVDLEVIVKAGKPQDQKNAAKILPVVKNHHLLLCTLLIGNALAMELIQTEAKAAEGAKKWAKAEGAKCRRAEEREAALQALQQEADPRCSSGLVVGRLLS